MSIGFDVKDEDLKKLDKGLQNTKHLVMGLGAMVTAASGVIVGLAHQVASVGDQAAKTADKLGLSVEALQEMRYAAELSGVAQGQFDTALQRMVRRSAEAARGTGEAKDALRELGVVVTDASGRLRSGDDLLADIADGMARVEDPSRRVALAFKLFDTEGVGMVNMLRGGSAALQEMRAEARGLGFVIADADARNAEKFNDALARARLVLVGIKNAIGVGLLPMMTNLLKRFQMWVTANREIIKANLEKVIRGVVAVIRQLSNAGRILWGVLADIIDRFGGLERVMNLAGISAGIFIGLFSASAIGSALIGITKLTSAMTALGTAGLIANLKIFGVPLAIAALIALAAATYALVTEDIYRFVEGDKSVTGLIVKKFEWAFNEVKKKVEEWKEKLIEAFENMKQSISEKIDWIKEKLQPIIDMIEVIKMFIKEKIEWAGKKIEIGAKAVGGVLEPATQAIGNAIENTFEFFGMVPEAAPATSGVVHNNSKINVSAPIKVTVPEGTTPRMVETAVRKGIDDGLRRILDDADANLKPTEAH